MELIVIGFGFVICYFLFDLTWWLSLLIACAAPILISLVAHAIGLPILGIATIVGKIRARHQRDY